MHENKFLYLPFFK